MVGKSAALSLIVVFLLLAACGNNKVFDAAAWRTADARGRGRMSEDLVKSRILVGKNVDEVQQLLGKADTDYVGALSYKINLGWPFKDPRHYGLLIYLDSNRNVTEAKIVD